MTDNTVIDRPEDAEIRNALQRVLKSKAFSRSERARELIKYLVEQEMAGAGDRLKGYSIAQDVFGKNDEFDPQNDAVVRVQAGRLRESLANYYEGEGEGAGDAVRIHVARGSYVPSYEIVHSRAAPNGADAAPSTVSMEGSQGARDRTSASVLSDPKIPVSSFVVKNIRAIWVTLFIIIMLLGAILYGVWRQSTEQIVSRSNLSSRAPISGLVAPSVPSIAIFLQNAPDEEAGNDLVRRLTNAASRFRTVRLLNSDSENATTNAVQPDFVVDVDILDNGTGQVSISHRPSGETVWSANVTNDPDKRTAFNYSLQAALSATLLPSGALYSFLAERDELPPLAECLWETNTYYILQSEAQFIEAYKCHEQLVAQDNPSALAYADLASLMVERITDNYVYPETADGAEALATARRALEAGTFPESYRALGIALSLTDDVLAREEAYRKAFSLNPFDIEIAASYGWSLLRSRAFSEAAMVLSDVLDNSFAERTWWSYSLFISAYFIGDISLAADAASKLAGSPRSHYVAARLIIAHETGNEPLRLELLSQLGQSNALIARDPAAYYTKLYGEEASAKFVRSLAAAGFNGKN